MLENQIDNLIEIALGNKAKDKAIRMLKAKYNDIDKERLLKIICGEAIIMGSKEWITLQGIKDNYKQFYESNLNIYKGQFYEKLIEFIQKQID